MNRWMILLLLASSSTLVAGCSDVGTATDPAQGSCRAGSGSPDISLSLGGVEQSPKGGQVPTVDVDVTGVVEASAEGHVVIETCAPGGNCTSKKADLSLTGSGIPSGPLVPVGALVRLHYFSEWRQPFEPGLSTSPGYHFFIQNLASWEGMTNAVASSEIVWLSAESVRPNGSLTLPSGFDPFTLTSKLECESSNISVFARTLAIPGGASVTAGQGDTVTVDATGAMKGHYTFTNAIDENSMQGDVGENPSGFVLRGQ